MKKILLNSSIFLTALLCFALTTNKAKAQTITLGTGTVTNGTFTYPAPYGNGYEGARHQFLVTKTELDNALANIASINSVGFDVVQAEGTPLQGFEIKIGHTTLNDLTSWQTGLTSVYGPVTYTETNGWNNHIFNSSFSWNGTDNVVIEVCFNNSGFSSNAIVNQSATSNISSYYYRADAGGVCSNNSVIGNPQQRPNLRMNVQQSVPVDLAMLSVDSVFNGSHCGLTNAETVYAAAKFTGEDSLLPGDTVFFSYQLDNQTIVTEFEVLVDTLFQGDTLPHTFTQTVDVSAFTSYELTNWITNSKDTIPSNDTLVSNFNNTLLVNSFPYFEDFESGKGSWKIGENSVNSTWAFGTPNKTEIKGAASGDSAWVTGGLGNGFYQDNDNSWIISPCFDFTNVDSTYWVGMKAWWDTEETWDGASLQFSIDGGSTWNNVGSFNDPHNWFNDPDIFAAPGGQQEGWSGDQSNSGSKMWVQTKHTLDGTGLAGQPEVRFRVAFASDPPFFTPEWDGFAFDDFAIGVPTQIAIVEDDDTACAGVDYTISANLGYGSYLWSTGATTQTTSVSDTGTHVVSVIYTDTLGFCTTDTVTIRLKPSTPTAILGPDTINCGPYVLDGNNFYVTHDWNTGETTPTITVPEDTTGLFIVATSDIQGNCYIDSANVTTLPVPVTDLGADFTVCNGAVASLNAGGGFVTYNWSSGGNAQNEIVNPIDGQTTTFYVTVTNAEGCEGVDSVKITSEDCTGIIELGNGSNLSVFPNPAKDVITVAISGLTEEFALSLVDAQGRIIFAEQANNGEKYTKDFNLAKIANGIYYLKLQTSDKVITEKVILQH